MGLFRSFIVLLVRPGDIEVDVESESLLYTHPFHYWKIGSI